MIPTHLPFEEMSDHFPVDGIVVDRKNHRWRSQTFFRHSTSFQDGTRTVTVTRDASRTAQSQAIISIGRILAGGA